MPAPSPITEELLRRLYVDEGRSLAAIGAVIDRSPSGVRLLLDRYGIPNQGRRPPRLDDGAVDIDRARTLYLSGLSLKAVAQELDTTIDKVKLRLHRAGVVLRRSGSPAGRLPALDAAWLRDGYVERLLSVEEIAVAAGCSPSHVRNELRRLGVRRGRRPVQRSDWLDLTPEVLQQLYVVEQLTMTEIADRAGGSTGRVLKALRRAGIAARPVGTVPSRALVPLTDELLSRLYVDEGLSTAAIAAQVGGEAERVRHALIRAGIPRRPPGTVVTPLTIDRTELEDLVVHQRLTVDEIAAAHQTTANQVRLRRRADGIARRPPPPRPPPVRPPDAEIAELYRDDGVTLQELAVRYHVNRRQIHAWLAEAGVTVAARTSRASRRLLPAEAIARAYWDEDLTAADIAARHDTTLHQVLRTLHDTGVPVRLGGASPTALGVLDQLYNDREILAVLREYRIPVVPCPGPIAERFPTPTPLSAALLRVLYVDVGVSARHIEQLTGQPADQILDALHAAAIEVRPLGSTSPWRARQIRDLPAEPGPE